MTIRKVRFDLDFTEKDLFPKFTMKQYDYISLEITPLENGSTLNLEGVGTFCAEVNGEIYEQSNKIQVERNKITIDIDKEVINQYGRAMAEITITERDYTYTSLTFYFDVEKKINIV